MHFKQINDEIIYAECFESGHVELLKRLARNNARKRCRICTHSSPDESLHEMFIMHMRGNYIPPHSHKQGDESLFLIEGEGMITVFSDKGEIQQQLYLNSYNTSSSRYFRAKLGQIHSLFVFSEYFLFKETTLGPFDPSNMHIPDWSIAEGDVTNINKFLEESEQAFLQLRNQENSNESRL